MSDSYESDFTGSVGSDGDSGSEVGDQRIELDADVGSTPEYALQGVETPEIPPNGTNHSFDPSLLPVAASLDDDVENSLDSEECMRVSSVCDGDSLLRDCELRLFLFPALDPEVRKQMEAQWIAEEEKREEDEKQRKLRADTERQKSYMVRIRHDSPFCSLGPRFSRLPACGPQKYFYSEATGLDVLNYRWQRGGEDRLDLPFVPTLPFKSYVLFAH